MKLSTYLNEAYSKKDTNVVKAFTDKKSGDSRKFSTDGKVLDGMWMGGKKIAYWEGDKIVLNDLGSKSAQKVHNIIKKEVPPNWIKK